MKLTSSQQKFIEDSKDELQSIFKIWIEGLKDQLVEEEDVDKAAVMRKFIKEFKAFSEIIGFIEKEEINKDIDTL